MKSPKLILIGGGGHCKACIDVIEDGNQYKILGILDHSGLFGVDILGYKVIGTDADIPKYVEQGCHFLITVGQIKNAEVRKNIYLNLELNGAFVPPIISKRAHVSKYATIGKGTIVMHNAVVNASAKIGENCILNTGCNIEHDVLVGHHSHISTHAVVNGDCIIGNEVFIGSNSTISNRINITDNVVVGAGALIYLNIESPGVYIGNSVKKK